MSYPDFFDRAFPGSRRAGQGLDSALSSYQREVDFAVTFGRQPPSIPNCLMEDRHRFERIRDSGLRELRNKERQEEQQNKRRVAEGPFSAPPPRKASLGPADRPNPQAEKSFDQRIEDIIAEGCNRLDTVVDRVTQKRAYDRLKQTRRSKN